MPTAPMLVGCRGGDLEAICDRLNWRLLPSTVRCDGQPLEFSETKLTTFGRVQASRWDWERRRFVADSRKARGKFVSRAGRSPQEPTTMSIPLMTFQGKV